MRILPTPVSRGSTRFIRSCTGLVVLLVALVGSSCTSVQTRGVPVARLAPGPQVAQLTVVALEDRPEVRNAFERELAAALRSSTTSAEAGYARFGIADLRGDREALRRRFELAGVQFVLATRVSDRVTGLSRAPGHVGASGFDWEDLDSARYRLYTSGGEVSTIVRLDSKLYRVSDAAVIWSAATDAKLDENVVPEKLIKAIARSIASQLKRDRVVR